MRLLLHQGHGSLLLIFLKYMLKYCHKERYEEIPFCSCKWNDHCISENFHLIFFHGNKILPRGREFHWEFQYQLISLFFFFFFLVWGGGAWMLLTVVFSKCKQKIGKRVWHWKDKNKTIYLQSEAMSLYAEAGTIFFFNMQNDWLEANSNNY